MFHETPDLSKSFSPQPKPLVKAKKPPARLGAGKKTIDWEEARAELKQIFADQEITSCELRLKGCTHDNFLSFAHILKRRELSKADLYSVVLCCISCHTIVEALPHLEMKKLLVKIIQNRA